jgi:mRNA interferase RelE/StbE
MTWSVNQTRRFSRQYKKLHDNIIIDVDSSVEHIYKDPKIGKRKKGDLSALYVYKFYSGVQQYLLGYSLDESIKLIYLEAVAPHENFYRNLKR